MTDIRADIKIIQLCLWHFDRRYITHVLLVFIFNFYFKNCWIVLKMIFMTVQIVAKHMQFITSVKLTRTHIHTMIQHHAAAFTII